MGLERDVEVDLGTAGRVAQTPPVGGTASYMCLTRTSSQGCGRDAAKLVRIPGGDEGGEEKNLRPWWRVSPEIVQVKKQRRMLEVQTKYWRARGRVT